MRKSLISAVTLGLLGIPVLACLLFLTPRIAPDIQPPKIRVPRIDLANLLLGLDDLPPGWEIEYGPETHTRQEALGEESLFIQFLNGHTGQRSVHSVWRFRNEAAAVWTYDVEQEPIGVFITPKGGPPDGWDYISSLADQWQFGCEEPELYPGHLLCVALARYEEFISVSKIRIPNDDPSLQDLEKILRTIDERFAENLG